MRVLTEYSTNEICKLAECDGRRAWSKLATPEFWLALLNTDEDCCRKNRLHISPDGGCRQLGLDVGAGGPEKRAHEALRRRMSNEGHISVPDFLDGQTCGALTRAALSLLAHGWPVSFLLVFDEPWIIARALGQFMQSAVNDNLVLRYEMFFYCVDSTLGAARSRGIGPHRDAPTTGFDEFEDLLLPRHCTSWLALTEATVDNGTIYVIPPAKERGRTSSAPIREDWGEPLEVPAGTLLAWGGHVAHWGGVHDARRAKGPRVTFTCVASVEEQWGLPTLELVTSASPILPNLETRLERIRSLICGFEPVPANSPVAAVFDRSWPRAGASVTSA